MFKQALLPDTLRAVQLAAKISQIQTAYLAGGTALALHLNHRISTDLDFFTPEKFEANQVSTELRQYPEFKQEGKAWGTIWGQIGETKFSLFYYEYPLLFPTEDFAGVRVADKRDVAAMKVAAIADRGVRRDFVDLYFLAREYSLNEILGFYERKYRNLEDNLYHIVRSLTYFEEADREEKLPQMLVESSWEEIKRFFEAEAKQLAKARLGL